MGGKNKIAMADLRNSFMSIGYGEVETYIQSGNVIFTSAVQPDSDIIKATVLETFGVSTRVVLRTQSELEATVQQCPFPKTDGTKLHVGFMDCEPTNKEIAALEIEKFSPELAVLASNNIFLSLPNGIGNSTLPAYLERKFQANITWRNWNTVERIAQISKGS